MKKINFMFISMLIFFATSILVAQQGPPLLNNNMPSAPPLSINPPKPPAIGIERPQPIPPSPISKGIELQNLNLAVNNAHEVVPFIKPGKIIIRNTPIGEKELIGTFIYKGVPISIIHFSLITGEVLPMGYNEHSYSINVSLSIVRKKLNQIVNSLIAGDFACFKDPERAWSIPLIYNKMIIGEIKVSSNGLNIIPDYSVLEEQ